MATVEVSRTLVKSPPELWEELQGDRLSEVAGAAAVEPTEQERSLRWSAGAVRGTAHLEPAGWGTKVTLTAQVESSPARDSFWGRWRPAPVGEGPEPGELEARLSAVLDELGSAHRKPFALG